MVSSVLVSGIIGLISQAWRLWSEENGSWCVVRLCVLHSTWTRVNLPNSGNGRVGGSSVRAADTVHLLHGGYFCMGGNKRGLFFLYGR